MPDRATKIAIPRWIELVGLPPVPLVWVRAHTLVAPGPEAVPE